MLQVSCASYTPEPLSNATTSKLKQKAHKIVFLNYAISTTQQGITHLQLLNTKTTTGRLKQTKTRAHSRPTSKDFMCLQLDAKSTVLDKHHIKNPLQQTIEYLDANNNFKIKTVTLNSSLFTVRLQLHPATTHIAINAHDDTPLLVTNTTAL